jgi:hypothetical protein
MVENTKQTQQKQKKKLYKQPTKAFKTQGKQGQIILSDRLYNSTSKYVINNSTALVTLLKYADYYKMYGKNYDKRQEVS